MASGSRASDLAGRIWSGPSPICFAVVLRWQGALHGEELGVGISDNKAVISSLAPSHPSCGGGGPGFSLLLELRRSEFARRNEGPDILVNKLDGVELLVLTLSLFLCAMVALGKRQWFDLGLHREILLQFVLQLVVASSCHILVSTGIFRSTLTAALHRQRDAVQLLYPIVVCRLLRRASVLAMRWFQLFFSLQAGVPKRRVFISLVAAVHAGVSPSGAVPGNSAGGRGIKLIFVDGGEGPDGFFLYLCRVLSIKLEDSVVLFFYLEVLLVKCNPTTFI